MDRCKTNPINNECEGSQRRNLEIYPKSINQTLFIFGSGGFAREIKSYFLTIFAYGKVFFVDTKTHIDGVISQECYNKYPKEPNNFTILGSGIIEIKRRMLRQAHPPFKTIIHPHSSIINATIGDGCIIAPQAVVANSVKIGKHVLLNYGSTIGHDSEVSDLCVISPNSSIGGGCILESEVYVGAGAMIKEGLRIGRGATIGMGAVVTKDVPPDVTAIGVPAKW